MPHVHLQIRHHSINRLSLLKPAVNDCCGKAVTKIIDAHTRQEVCRNRRIGLGKEAEKIRLEESCRILPAML